MQVVYHWAKGTLFREICNKHMPDGVMEGDIVRTVNRLDQACHDIMSAARVMGNTALFEQFEEASKLIKRDIIFAGSLYVFK
jgi:antiviral helicase SKI2